jgi:arginase
VRAEDVALVGYRAFDDNDRFGDEHVRDSGITVLDYRDLRAGTTPLILGRALATVTRPRLQGFWVHLDVDVLDDAIMPAVDYRHPGGLSWDEATQLLQGLLGRPGARGLDVTIFNPNLDPDGSIARQLCELIARCVPAAG